MNQAIDMGSRIGVPDLRKPLSARLPESLLERLANVREIWREVAKVQGASKPTIDAIDLTHVVERLLNAVTDEELAQFGGFADTDEKRAAQLKAVQEATKAQMQAEKDGARHLYVVRRADEDTSK